MNYTPSILPSTIDGLLPFLNRELRLIQTAIAEKSPRLWYSSAILTPAVIAADQNNYAPPNLEGALWLRLSASGAYFITGLKNPEVATPRLFFLTNIGTFSLTLQHGSTSSAAAARFSFLGSGDLVLLQGATVLLGYDPTSLVWRNLSDST